MDHLHHYLYVFMSLFRWTKVKDLVQEQLGQLLLLFLWHLAEQDHDAFGNLLEVGEESWYCLAHLHCTGQSISYQ